MTNSFLKSLPSHKKKERQRKLRHQRRVGSQVVEHPNLEDDNAGADHWQNRPFVEQPRFSLGDAEQQNTNADESSCHDGEHSESSLLSHSSISVVPATECQYPPVPTGDTSGDELSNTSLPLHSAHKEFDDESRAMCSPLSGWSGKASNFLQCSRSKSCDLKRENRRREMSHENTGNETLSDADVAVSNDGLKKSSLSSNSKENKTKGSIADHLTSLNQRQSSQVALEDKEKIFAKEWVLTSSDIGLCIDEINFAISSHNGKQHDDLFDDVDLESFQSTLEGFKQYIIALGQQSSVEAVYLNAFHPAEQVFIIFEKGMSVDHCNAGFIHEMINHIVSCIEDSKRGEEEGDQIDHEPLKLHHLAGCIEITFGVYFDEVSVQSDDTLASFDTTFINISTIDNGTTKLLFRREPARSQDKPETIHQHTRLSLPPFLSEVSKIFEQYCEENALPLLSQLNSARKALHKTRQGAMKLQKTALDLQDQLQSAKLEVNDACARQSELEAELSRQKYEFDKRTESFERVKEHYKTLADTKEEEVMEMKRKLQHKAVIPETTYSMTSKRSHHHQKKVSPGSTKRDHSNDSNKQTEPVQKHGLPRADVEEDYDRHTKKKSRTSMEPQVSSYSRSEKRAIYEPPSAPSPQKATHSSLRYGLKANELEYRMNAEQRKQGHNDIFPRRVKRQDSTIDRNPLGSLTVNSFVGHSVSGNACEEKQKKAPKTDNQLRFQEASLTNISDEAIPTSSPSSTPLHSSKAKQLPVNDPYLMPRKSDDSESCDFKYQEVVRGKDARLMSVSSVENSTMLCTHKLALR
ncbi:hypothetical protein ACHAW6_009908 [Cyclotella cf. meneghiniana]